MSSLQDWRDSGDLARTHLAQELKGLLCCSFSLLRLKSRIMSVFCDYQLFDKDAPKEIRGVNAERIPFLFSVDEMYPSCFSEHLFSLIFFLRNTFCLASMSRESDLSESIQEDLCFGARFPLTTVSWKSPISKSKMQSSLLLFGRKEPIARPVDIQQLSSALRIRFSAVSLLWFCVPRKLTAVVTFLASQMLVWLGKLRSSFIFHRKSKCILLKSW